MNNDYNNPVPPEPQNGQNQQNGPNPQNGQYQQGYPQQNYQNQNPYGQQPPYPPMQYGQPQYMPPPPPPPQPGKGLATASLICSIFSLIILYTGPFAIVGVILGIIAIVTAACAKKKGFVGGMATAGLVMGIIGVVLSLAVFISCIACISAVSDSIAEEWSNTEYFGDWDWDFDDFDWNDYI